MDFSDALVIWQCNGVYLMFANIGEVQYSISSLVITGTLLMCPRPLLWTFRISNRYFAKLRTVDYIYLATFQWLWHMSLLGAWDIHRYLEDPFVWVEIATCFQLLKIIYDRWFLGCHKSCKINSKAKIALLLSSMD